MDIVFATKASRWKMGLVPSRILCSNVAAVDTMSYLMVSSTFRRSSCTSLQKIVSAGTQFTKSSYSFPLCDTRWWTGRQKRIEIEREKKR